jgi:hypothetical protein
MNLQNKIDALYRAAHELLHLGVNGEPIYADHFSKLNADIYRQAEALIPKRGQTPEEEAALCVALLSGYKATFLNYGDKEAKIQSLLDRSWVALDRLPASLLKCRLLVACYAEVFDGELAKQAHAIINTRQGRLLTPEEHELFDDLRNLEENPYPWSEVEE